MRRVAAVRPRPHDVPRSGRTRCIRNAVLAAAVCSLLISVALLMRLKAVFSVSEADLVGSSQDNSVYSTAQREGGITFPELLRRARERQAAAAGGAAGTDGGTFGGTFGGGATSLRASSFRAPAPDTDGQKPAVGSDAASVSDGVPSGLELGDVWSEEGQEEEALPVAQVDTAALQLRSAAKAARLKSLALLPRVAQLESDGAAALTDPLVVLPLDELLSSRQQREGFSVTEFQEKGAAILKKPGATTDMFDDTTVLFGKDDDPDAGLLFHVPKEEEVDPALLDPTRLAHAAAADVVVAIPTAPRVLLPWRDPIVPHYWRARGDCKAMPVVQQLERPLSAGPADPAWLYLLADTCDKTPQCEGFNAEGVMWGLIDATYCEITAAQTVSGMPSPGAGLYMKRPPTALQPIHNRTIKEWFLDPEAQPLQGVPEYMASVLQLQGVTAEAREGRVEYSQSAPPPLSWYVAERADVVGSDLMKIDVTANGKLISKESQLRFLRSRCMATPGCAGFNYPGGWLKSTVDVTAIHASTKIMSDLWSRLPIPPLDYLVPTVVSLARELERLSPGTCGLSNDRALYPSEMEGVPDPDTVSAAAFQPTAPGQASALPPNGDPIIMGPPTPVAPFNHTPSFHVMVFDTSPTEKQAPPDSARAEMTPDYWFTAFNYLRKRYGHSPCFSFVSASSYVRLIEEKPPAFGRGNPSFHKDNRGKHMPRQQVGQTLDFASAFRYALARSPNAHLLVWEDDCYACQRTMEALGRATRLLSLADPKWGALKVGNGGSGLLFNRDIAAGLIAYIQTRRGSDNIDVSMWRYVYSQGLSDYLSLRTRSAHRGLTSSFRLAQGAMWGRVICGNELDFYWGFYNPCHLPSILTASGRSNITIRNGTVIHNNDVAAQDAQAFAAEWRCSTYSRLGLDIPQIKAA